MPWSSNSTLPKGVRSSLPAAAQTRWRSVANGALGRGASDESAARQAWHVVGQGWKKPKGEGKWVRKEARTLFVSRPLENTSDLIDWAKGQGFPTTQTPSQLHTTIAYSKDPVDWPIPYDDKVTINSKASREVIPLGDGGAVVLRFESPTLEARWKELKEEHGASWDFDGYRPHVTISWEAKEIDLSSIEPYDGELIFGPEIFREIDENWRTGVTEKFLKAEVLKVDEELGLVFGWAIVSKINGENYFDLHDDHIPEDSMLKASMDFMMNSRVIGEMHHPGPTQLPDGSMAHVIEEAGTAVFAFPLTEDIGKAMGIKSEKTGLMIAIKPDADVLEKFRSGELKAFSIGGSRIKDEEVEDA